LLRRLFSESAVYGLGGVGAQALGILLVPLYANALGSASYGVLAVLTTTLSLSSMVATLALPQTFFKWYFQESSTPAERAHVMEVTLGVRLAASVVGAAGLALLAIPLAVLLFGGRELPLLLLLVPVVLCDSLTSHPLSYLRAERRAGPYAALSFSRAVLGSGLAVILVLFAGLGVAGVVLGSLISSSAVLGASYAALGSRGAIRLAWDRRMATAMLAFSLPLLPASIAGWALNLSDRYVLQAFEGPATVGVYAVGYTIGLAINAVVLAPFSLAWGAAYWEIARGPHPERSFSRVMIGFLVLSSFAALGVSALATDLMRHLFRPEFEPGRFVVPFSAFGHVLSGVYVLGSAGLNLRSQTRWQPVLVVGAALANVVLNLTLVPPLGFMGAAVSTVVCYGLLGVVTTMVAQRYYSVPWDVPRSAGAVMVAAALTAAALLGPDHVVWRIACVAAYPALAIALRIVRRADLQAAASLIGRPPRR
jgi:O-antigen/teichoic acid export membrane protein